MTNGTRDEKTDNAVSRALGAVDDCLGSYVEDYSSGIEDGTYDDRDGLDRAEAAQAAFRAMAPALAKLYGAGRSLIDALGGQPIDWLKSELIALEEALVAIDKAPSPESEAAPGPKP